MILLITPFASVQRCGKAIEEAISEGVDVTESLRQAIVRLRAAEYSVVVIDQSLMEAEPEDSDTVLQHIGAAVPVQVNFGISGVERVVREVRAALNRRKREERIARESAARALYSEVKGSVTALLLSCEVALETPDLPRNAAQKIQAVQQLAQDLRAKLSPITGS
jgi:hypothetical protein